MRGTVNTTERNDRTDELELTLDEKRHYARHLILPEIGMAGQLRLKNASILVIGAGGLGSPLALYMAAAGVGRIRLVDGDVVDVSNLHRQILFGVSDTGRPKADAAAERLRDMNPSITIEPVSERITTENAYALADGCDVIIDGADNFPTRYLCNDLAVLTGTPLVHGSIFKFDGQVTVLGYEGGACYRCIYPEAPPAGSVPSCGEVGVLGVLPGAVGTLMATETLKIILGLGDVLSERLLIYDALAMTTRVMRYARDPDCPVCGDAPTITDLSAMAEQCGYTPGGHETVGDITTSQQGGSGTVPGSSAQSGENAMSIPAITVQELNQWRTENRPHTLIDVREQNEYDFANIGGTLIPLGQLSQRIDEIPEDGDVVVMCRSGGRSAQAVATLQAAGRKNVHNLTGGILGWADAIDPAVPKY